MHTPEVQNSDYRANPMKPIEYRTTFLATRLINNASIDYIYRLQLLLFATMTSNLIKNKRFFTFFCLCAVAYVAIEDPEAIERFLRELFSEETVDNDDKEESNEALIATGLAALEAQRTDQRPRKKRCKSRWDWARAKKCVEDNYTGLSPIFNDRQFERVFRITRGRADTLLSICAKADPFFTQTIDAVTKKEGICLTVKLLMALKLIAYYG